MFAAKCSSFSRVCWVPCTVGSWRCSQSKCAASSSIPKPSLNSQLCQSIFHAISFPLINLMTDCCSPNVFRYVKDTTAFITVLTVCIYSHYFWTMGRFAVSEEIDGLSEKLVTNFCMFRISTVSNEQFSPNTKFARVWFLFNAVLSGVLPYVVISTLLVTYCVKKRQPELTCDKLDVTQKPGTSHESAYLLRKMKRRKELGQHVDITKAFIRTVYPTLCFCYLLCTIPDFTYKTFDFLRVNNPISKPYWPLLETVFTQLKTSFYAVKVVIYIICSQHVRNETGAFMTFLWKSFRRLCRYICCQGTRESRENNQRSRVRERAERH